jgi:hypothetical protein
VQAGVLVLEIRRAVSGGATATRASSAGGDTLSRRAPCTPDTHQRKHAATGGRVAVLCTLHANACAQCPDLKAFTYSSMHAEADKTRFRLTWFFSFSPPLIRSANSSTMPFSAA